MLGTSAVIVSFIWYKLGGSSEYRGGTIEMDPMADPYGVAGDKDGDDKDVVPANGGAVRVQELSK